jgi:hypothetical protein
MLGPSRRWVRRRLAGAFASAVLLIAPLAQGDDAACIAASEQSLVLRHQGKLHDALKELAVCADPKCPEEVKTECGRRIDLVGTAMPTLVLVAKDGAGNDLNAVTVTMDGAPLVPSLDGRALSIDPGEHTFRFETAGQPPVEKKLVVREGEKDRQVSVVLGAAPAAVVPPAPSPPAAPPPAAPHPTSWSTRKTLALVGGGTGVVGLGLGIVFGVYAKSSQSQEKSNCSSTSQCSNRNQSNEDYSVARQNAMASTISAVAGAALVAAGGVLWFTAPKTNPDIRAARARTLGVAPTVMGTSGGGLMIGGDL